MMWILFALALAVSLQPSVAAKNDTIVVTAKRLHAAKNALAACRARGCPPNEEIESSMAFAEQQFLDGDYRGARRTLLNARHRNAKYAKSFPVEVATLMNANATLANMNGYPDSARINTIDSLDVLKAGLEPGNARILTQRLNVGVQLAHEGRLAAAQEFYRTVERQARAANHPKIAAQAILRTAVTLVAIADVFPNQRDQARDEIDKLRALPGDEYEPFRLAAQALDLALTNYKGSARDAIAAVAASSPATPANQAPVLLYQDRLDVTPIAGVTSEDVTQWANIAFVVTPAGTVRNIETLSRSAHFADDWIDLIDKTIASRIYRPVAAPQGTRRIERYSVTHDPLALKASRLRLPSATPRIEITDLTPDPVG